MRGTDERRDDLRVRCRCLILRILQTDGVTVAQQAARSKVHSSKHKHPHLWMTASRWRVAERTKDVCLRPHSRMVRAGWNPGQCGHQVTYLLFP